MKINHLTYAELRKGDFLLNDKGEIYRVTRLKSLGFSHARHAEIIDVKVCCMTNENASSALNADMHGKVNLHNTWLWHSRHGCLLM